MAFHVEIRRGLRRASEFNLDESRLRRRVLEPWTRGQPVELGDHEWEPGESRLTVLEGSELAPPELAHGQGWHNARRSGNDVTAHLLASTRGEAAAAVALLAATPAAADAGRRLLAGLGLNAIEWAAVRARILGGSPAGPGVATAVLLLDGTDPPRGWLLEAGLALGALGRRAVLAQLGREPSPPELQDLAVMRLDPDRPESLRGLVERLRS